MTNWIISNGILSPVCSKNRFELVFIIAYSLSFSIIRLRALVCLEIAMHNEQFHSFVQSIHSFIHSSNKGQCIHATFGIHTILYNHTSSSFFFFSFSFYSFFFFLLLVCVCVCSIVIENLFKTRIYIYILQAYTYTYQYCHIYLCVHNFLPPFSLKNLSRFIHGVIYNLFSFFYCPYFMTGKITKHFI